MSFGTRNFKATEEHGNQELTIPTKPGCSRTPPSLHRFFMVRGSDIRARKDDG